MTRGAVKKETYAKNHPGGGTAGSTPNWYYYWSQTSASWGVHEYRDPLPGKPKDVTGVCVWENGRWIAVIGKGAEVKSTPYVSPETPLYGIDSFAHVCRHEWQHVLDFREWWPNGYEEDRDNDPLPIAMIPPRGDWVPDDWEIENGYDPKEWDSQMGGVKDSEYHADFSIRGTWTVGDSDAEDWANPGKNHGTGEWND